MKDWTEADAWYFAHLLSRVGRPKLGGESVSREARDGVEHPADAGAPSCLASPPTLYSSPCWCSNMEPHPHPHDPATYCPTPAASLT